MRQLRRRRGAAQIEYALLLTLIAFSLIGVIAMTGSDIGGLFCTASNTMGGSCTPSTGPVADTDPTPPTEPPDPTPPTDPSEAAFGWSVENCSAVEGAPPPSFACHAVSRDGLFTVADAAEASCRDFVPQAGDDRLLAAVRLLDNTQVASYDSAACTIADPATLAFGWYVDCASATATCARLEDTGDWWGVGWTDVADAECAAPQTPAQMSLAVDNGLTPGGPDSTAAAAVAACSAPGTLYGWGYDCQSATQTMAWYCSAYTAPYQQWSSATDAQCAAFSGDTARFAEVGLLTSQQRASTPLSVCGFAAFSVAPEEIDLTGDNGCRSVTVRNRGSGSMVLAVDSSALGSHFRTCTPNGTACSGTLGAGEDCSLGVGRQLPLTQTGSFDGTLAIHAGVDGSEFDAAVEVHDEVPEDTDTAQLQLEPGQLSLVPADGCRTATLRNVGDAPAALTYDLSQLDTAHFQACTVGGAAPACSDTLAAGGECALGYSVLPGAAGRYTAKVTVAHDGQAYPLSLVGTVVPAAAGLTADPEDIAVTVTNDWSWMPRGEPISLTFTNTGGQDTAALAMSFSEDNLIVDSDGCTGQVLHAGDLCAVSVTPTAYFNWTVTDAVTASDGTYSATALVRVTGQGFVYGLVASDGQLDVPDDGSCVAVSIRNLYFVSQKIEVGFENFGSSFELCDSGADLPDCRSIGRLDVNEVCAFGVRWTDTYATEGQYSDTVSVATPSLSFAAQRASIAVRTDHVPPASLLTLTDGSWSYDPQTMQANRGSGVGVWGQCNDFTVTNASDTALNLGSPRLGDPSTVFGTMSICSSSCGGTLMPGGSCSIGLTYDGPNLTDWTRLTIPLDGYDDQTWWAQHLEVML